MVVGQPHRSQGSFRRRLQPFDHCVPMLVKNGSQQLPSRVVREVLPNGYPGREIDLTGTRMGPISVEYELLPRVGVLVGNPFKCEPSDLAQHEIGMHHVGQFAIRASSKSVCEEMPHEPPIGSELEGDAAEGPCLVEWVAASKEDVAAKCHFHDIIQYIHADHVDGQVQAEVRNVNSPEQSHKESHRAVRKPGRLAAHVIRLERPRPIGMVCRRRECVLQVQKCRRGMRWPGSAAGPGVFGGAGPGGHVIFERCSINQGVQLHGVPGLSQNVASWIPHSIKHGPSVVLPWNVHDRVFRLELTFSQQSSNFQSKQKVHLPFRGP